MTLFKRPQAKTTVVFSIGFGTGMLIALPVAAPLLGGILPDGVASLWGAAIGAFIAVAGAFWAAGAPLRMQRKNASALVYSLLSPSVFFLEEITFMYGERSSLTRPESDQEPDMIDPTRWPEIADASKIFLNAHHAVGTKLNRIDGALNFLGPEELSAVFSMETELQSAAGLVAELQEDAIQIEKKFYGGYASWGMRFALRVALNHLKKDLRLLESAGQ